MAHFAKLDSNNIVEQVIVVSNDDTADNDGVEQESIGIGFCQKFAGSSTTWKQTSYNARGTGFRGNYAGIGNTYMENVATLGVAATDIFIPQRPTWQNPGNGAGSWSISTTAAEWISPIGHAPGLTTAQHLAGQLYYWDEKAYQANNSVGWALTTP